VRARPFVYLAHMSDDTRVRGAGGTEGGIGTFLLGFVMAVAGGWLLTNQVTVTSGGWRLWGYNAFGLSLLPFIAGIAFLFFNGKSIIGWLLTIAGAVIIFIGILTNLDVYFRPTTLFNTILMFVLLMGGIGLIARSLSPRRSS
jgi:predicted membrane channel-forming protein YqfA (hemolysin III family)